MPKALVIALLCYGLVACQSGSASRTVLPMQQDVASTAACPQPEESLETLEGCMQQSSLWRILTRFQSIADAHPDAAGHPNRDSGTPGYKASVQYVAEEMRRAGYHVVVQSYPLLRTITDYNVIADSPFGNSRHVVVIDAHLDSIDGAGMLDNASGSTTILAIALNLAKTHTRNKLRFIWFGGEEIGLAGSFYYTRHLRPSELQRIAFDVDADDTATPNFDYLVKDPKDYGEAASPKTVRASQFGNALFYAFFKRAGVPSHPANFGRFLTGSTDSYPFAIAGVPDTGILTGQDCCKSAWEKQLWGGYLGNYEGTVPGTDGGCADYPGRWCDNLSNNDPAVLELASKATAYVTFHLANHQF